MAVKIFERHLAREIYSATALVTAAFLALFGFFDLIGELADLGKGGYQFLDALGFVVLTLPGRVYEILPISVLIGSLYALTHLARDSEITVLRASGLSTSELRDQSKSGVAESHVGGSRRRRLHQSVMSSSWELRAGRRANPAVCSVAGWICRSPRRPPA